MDDLDKQILRLLCSDARMTVKDIAAKVSLTSPAVSERIKRLERSGTIASYTVVLGESSEKSYVDALISVSVPHTDRQYFLNMLEGMVGVRQCYHVTGSYSFIVKVRCGGMEELERMINHFQKLGQTSTQIILSVPVDRRPSL